MTLKEKKKAHRATIKVHRREVRKWCFKMGIPLQGILHDLSKYSKEEFSVYKYYTGTRSPHDVARDRLGFSPSWYHHRNHNKHHWEYWTDWNKGFYDEKYDFYIKAVPIKMPYKYVIEMFCDYIGAGKAYMKDKWTPSAPYEYHMKLLGEKLYHSDTACLLFVLFRELKEQGEEKFLKYYKENKKKLQRLYKTDGGIYEVRYKSPVEPLYSSDR